MKARRTTRPIEAATRGGLKFEIPRGAAVDLEPYDARTLEGGPWYYVKPGVFGKWTIERHDATYYGFGVRHADTEEYEI